MPKGVKISEKSQQRMVHLYVDKLLSTQKIADKFGLSRITVSRILRSQGVDIRKPGYSGVAPDRYMTKNGYAVVFCPEEFLVMSWYQHTRGRPRVFEHRLVMAKYLGRALESYETVHHINGARDDNRIENLQLRIGKHGNGSAYECLDCGSFNVAPALLKNPKKLKRLKKVR